MLLSWIPASKEFCNKQMVGLSKNLDDIHWADEQMHTGGNACRFTPGAKISTLLLLYKADASQMPPRRVGRH